MALFRLLLWMMMWQQTTPQVLGPSLWDWGYINITSYVIYPVFSYDSSILVPHGENEKPSACNGNNPADPNDVGFSCPHLLLFSSDLLLAASRDGIGDDFFYGTAATKNDEDCGKCFQVRVMDPETQWNNSTPPQKQLILQITNSGMDVVPGQFDVHIGAGGFGYYTACNQDCRQHFCQGGPCAIGFFNSSFQDWTPDLNCYGGGLRVFSTDTEKIWDECGKLTIGYTYKDYVLRQTCWYANVLLYHQNFFSTNSVRVRCPIGLTKATGLKRTDEDNLPPPDRNNKPDIFCRNNKCITGYHDCCKMSCSWKYKGKPDPVFSRAYTCDHNGYILV